MMRVTQGMMTRRSLNNLNYQVRRLMQLQEELATGLKVNAPSDDPLAARRAVNIRAAIEKTEQYITNISSSESILTETGTALQTVTNVLQRGRELCVQGASGTNSQVQRDLIAVEINQLVESLVVQGNHLTQGRYVFAGTRTGAEPFDVTRNADGEITSVVYVGNENDIKIAVGDTVDIAINENGQSAFMSLQNIFQTFIDIRDNLRNNEQSELQGDRLSELKAAQDQTLASVARVGAIQNRMDGLKEDFETYVQQLKLTRSDNIDADYAETVINLDAQSNAFRAALNAVGRVIQPTLLDFIS